MHDGTRVSVNMMKQTENFHFLHDFDGSKWLVMPYEGFEYSMLAYLPPVVEKKGPAQPPTISKRKLQSLKKQKVRVQLPRYSNNKCVSNV